MTRSKTNILFTAAVLLNSAVLGAAETIACNPGDTESGNYCNGKTNCVEVKTKQHCNENRRDFKKYYVEPEVETMKIYDEINEKVTIIGSKKWKFELVFLNGCNDDVTKQLIKSKNLTVDCDEEICSWELRGGGLNTKTYDVMYKYTIRKHQSANHDVEPLDPSVIIKPQR